MKENLQNLIKNYKMGHKENFLKIYELLKPTVAKYSRHLYFYDPEDSTAELTLALLEALEKIHYFDNEGKYLCFLLNALKNKYMELIRKSVALLKHETDWDMECLICPYIEYAYSELELMADINQLLASCNEKQQLILQAILFKGLSCSQAAKDFHVSRQYANRIKNILLPKIGSTLFSAKTDEKNSQSV